MQTALELGTIIVVDDDPAIVKVIEGSLTYAGHNVYATTDPKEALAIYRENWPQIALVVSDFLMPGLRGDQFWAALHDINPDLRFLLVTGCADDEAHDLIHRERLPVVRKPFHLDELLQAVSALHPRSSALDGNGTSRLLRSRPRDHQLRSYQ